MLAALLALLASVPAQTPAAGWQTIKDVKGVCQIMVPPDWEPLSGSAGAAVFQGATTAIAVVTSQPGQAFQPLAEKFLKVLDVPKDKLFQNTAKRTFYQDRISRHPDEPNAFSSSVPNKAGTCSCHIVVLPSVTDETAKKIALSLGPVQE